MKEIKFNTRKDFLTENSLGDFLSVLFKEEEIIHNKKIKDLEFRPDYYLPNLNLVVEFDGYRHFTDNKVVVSDIRKEWIMSENNISFIRIPYFVQLSKRNIEILFKDFLKDKEIVKDFNKYEDGFIDKNAALPGQFSSLGLERYHNFNRHLVQDCEEEGLNLLIDIQFSLTDKFVLDDYDFFECFPETDYNSIKFNYQCIKDCYDSYEYEEEGVKNNLIDLKWLKDYIEVILEIDTDFVPDPEIREDFSEHINKETVVNKENLSKETIN